MSKREELVTKLGELKKEFEGFPEEQTINEVIDELSTKDSRLTVPSPDGETILVTDLFLMAKTLGAYCHGRPCDGCAFNNGLLCPHLSWVTDIDAKMLAEHEGEVVTFFPEEE